MPSLIVQKFGGSSLADLAKINNIALIVKQELDKGNKIICVVSAMGSDTDRLFRLASELSAAPPRRELDMLLSSGERKSAALLSIALNQMGYEGFSLTGSQCGILTDHIHGNAKIKEITGERIREALLDHSFVVVAGYQGVCPQTKEITTLGRGGSDLTAVALSISLRAKECQIYTDVNGIMTADPRVVSSAMKIPEVSWCQMTHMACSGARVLHYRAATLAQKYNVPLRVLNSGDLSEKGTMILGREDMEKPEVLSIAHKKNQSHVRFQFRGDKPYHLMSMISNWLWEKDEQPQVFRSHLNRDQGSRFEIEMIMTSHLIPRLESEILNRDDEQYLFSGSCRSQEGATMVTLIGTGFKQSSEFSKLLVSSFKGDPLLFEIEDQLVRLLWEDQLFQKNIETLHNRFILEKGDD